MTAHPIFALVAGEASGDQLGAALIAELRRLYPNARFVGIGGTSMRDAGMEIWWDSEELAVFGLFEVLAHFPRLLSIRRQLLRRVRQLKPHIFIGIDAPDFNLGLEIQLRSAGFKTIHYVSPTVWAWRARRVKKIARAADLVLCLFPFEPDYYRHRGVAAAYVGHPMADQIPMHSNPIEARQTLQLAEAGRVVALLPGSRVSEVSRLAAPMIEAAGLLSQAHPDLQFIAAIANARVREVFRTALSATPAANIRLIEGQPRTVLAAADLVLCASGTATLETMLINRPLVAAYQLAPSTYYLAKVLNLIKAPFFALPNILAGEALIPELIQGDATGKRLAEESGRWLGDSNAREVLAGKFEALHVQLRCNASVRAATCVAELLGETA